MKDVTAEMERFMTAGAIVHGNPRFSVREDDAPGALGYAADVFAVIAGAERYELRSYLTGAPSPRTCGESEREWAALLRDLHLRDEALPALVVRSRTGGAMFLVFGRHGGPLGVIRLDVDGTRGFRPPQIAATRRFLDEHGAALTHWIVDGAAPLRPVLAEEPALDDSPLHALYRPRNGHAPPLLAGTLTQLIGELAASPRGVAVSRALPFAFVRLARLAGGSSPFFLVSVEPARRLDGDQEERRRTAGQSRQPHERERQRARNRDAPRRSGELADELRERTGEQGGRVAVARAIARVQGRIVERRLFGQHGPQLLVAHEHDRRAAAAPLRRRTVDDPMRERGTVLVEKAARRGDLRRPETARAVDVEPNHAERAAMASEDQEHRTAGARAYDQRGQGFVAQVQIAQQRRPLAFALPARARRRCAGKV